MSPLIFIIIGVILVIIELLVLDFTFVFFGAGFLIVGLFSFALPLSWEVQILASFVLSFALLLALKKPLKSKFFKPTEEIKDNFLDESGEGYVKEGMVYFKGTLWQSDEIKNMAEGTKVRVRGVKDGQIILEK
ncbi:MULTISPECIES: NfeD family protein [unclassified Campylobacter]|uniref:NfeD family protein n=1 Tax=unclassified Campylobacter TaxID=2593542 RepID=UPI0022E9FBFD|nr:MULTISPECIES: NfeD family protein [unclassified Campylobacter]MDA3043571.1 NfeD family protein [Campylobacter sp. JMF_09 ED2]MDA3044118.1 NfeD family protein [Campylobacter sp. JMF_07 ED4]MDA3063468.1 NfeD family protein [Campylobacter sp. JMF_11 EL3]MDA3071093.1 NfeD family protein [Campylobacter sp. VBCF_03 NA9]MDA3074553.1 NfeD family protein [Campylobacter sp. JMF_05 ED3]